MAASWKSAPIEYFWASALPFASSSTSGVMAPAFAMMGLLSPAAPGATTCTLRLLLPWLTLMTTCSPGAPLHQRP